jgi:predicted RNA-binding protein
LCAIYFVNVGVDVSLQEMPATRPKGAFLFIIIFKDSSLDIPVRFKGRISMCEAQAFILKDGREETILDSVDILETEGDEIRLINIFGEQKMLKGRLKRYDYRQGKMLFEPLV